MDELKASGKPFRDIEAGGMGRLDQKVTANKGAPGRTGSRHRGIREGSERQSLQDLEPDVLGDVLPAPGDGGGDTQAAWRGDPRARGAGVADRIAQTVAAARLEKAVEPLFHPGSYGYRPRRGALDAVAACRERCWKYSWVVDLDIRKFFDSVRWDLIVKAAELTLT